MAIKKICQLALISMGLACSSITAAQDSPFGQTFQINTRLNSFVGKPSWLIIVRDVNTGQVLPYLYNFNSTDNFWLGMTYSHTYQVVVSELEFGPPNAIIHNFCHLQDGILDRESFTVELSGDLTPNRRTSRCHIFKYKQFPFPIAEPVESSASTETTSGAAAGPLAGPISTNLANALSSVSNALGPGVTNGFSNVVSNALGGNVGK